MNYSNQKGRSNKNTVIKSLCRAAMIIIGQDLRHTETRTASAYDCNQINMTASGYGYNQISMTAKAYDCNSISIQQVPMVTIRLT